MKRIYMISTNPLFSLGIEALLHQNTEFEIVGRETDIDKGIECIRILRPDIVIVDHEYSSCTQSPGLMKILDAGLGIKIIGLNLLANTLCIYRGEQKSAYQVEDLLQAIENDPNESKIEKVTAPQE